MSKPHNQPVTYEDLERLEVYGSALRQMRKMQFHGVPVPDHVSGPLDTFGEELAELGDWLEQRFEQFRKLQSLSEEIGSELFAENVLDRIYKTFSTLIPYDRIGCALLEQNGARLRAFWAKADYPDMRISKNYAASMSGSSLQTILATGTPRIINDLEAYQRENPGSKATRTILAEGILSNLTCPLIANGKPLGFLFFSSREKNTYRDLHHDIFLQIAGQVSVLIEKSLLYQQLYELNSQLMEAHQKLKDQAMHDALTGVLNRGAIFSLLESELCKAARTHDPLVVIMADLDHFKSINDRHGHLAGDEVLRTVASAIDDTLRGYDHVGRYGGEEFLILLSGTDTKTAVDIAERIRETVANLEVVHQGGPIRPTISQGVALSETSGSAEQVIARADAALYKAKEDGRNCHRVAPTG